MVVASRRLFERLRGVVNGIYLRRPAGGVPRANSAYGDSKDSAGIVDLGITMANFDFEDNTVIVPS